MTVPLDIRNDIRSMDADGVSRSEIARRLHVSRNTVSKYADMEDMSPVAPVRRARERPGLEGNGPWIEKVLDLVLMGDVGTGKTHMASALCALACERRIEARFFTASSLVARLRRAREEGRLDREAAQIGRAGLLVIDELGFLPLDAEGARLMFQVFADAYERQSVLITTNLEFSRWGSVFGDDQMAAAVIDRIVHHGRLIQFRGESYRVRHALMREE